MIWAGEKQPSVPLVQSRGEEIVVSESMYRFEGCGGVDRM
jgi:hypothetical protein